MNDYTPDWYPKESPKPTTPEPVSAEVVSAETVSTEGLSAGTELVPLKQALYTAPRDSRMRTSRRNFLGLAVAAGAAVAGGSYLLRNGDEVASPTAAPQETTSSPTAEVDPPVMTNARPLPASADVSNRTLVVVELQGGNDGLATLVPREAGVLYDSRESVHIPDEELLTFTPEFGWNPRLAGLAGHGLAAVVGLGTMGNPDGSHFEMERRWWAGKSSGRDIPFTGFFGRLCDQLATDQPITGVSIGSNASPALRADNAVTIGLSDMRAGWFLQSEEPFYANMRRAMNVMATGSDMPATMSGDSMNQRMTGARSGLSDTLSFGRTLAEIDEDRIREAYPRHQLGDSFGAASELIRQEAGLRVIHITHGGFDTHSNQLGTHNNLLEQLGDSMGAFLSDLEDSGHADSTLVCTTSEFGRRVTENRGGTDHGQAGMAILSGPVNAGVHGEAPSLTNLDDGNLVATVDFEQYYSTIAEQWFGIPSSEVLDSGAAPIEGLIAT